MRPIAEAAARISGKSFSRKYIALGRVVNHWSEIVGPDMAAKAQPLKIRYMKEKMAKTPSAALDIAVAGADATLLHYQKDLILERINRIFGEGWITGIRFVQAPVNSEGKRRSAPKKPLTEQEKTYLSGILENVGDNAIKAGLAGLGEALIKDSKAELK